ncbi:MAG: diacylglycerol/polyprenol kinase family protein [Bdellovibrionales bacterium]
MALKARDDIHIARRLWHFFGVLLIAAAYWALDPRQSAVAVIAVSSFIIGFDWLRLRLTLVNRFFQWVFRPFLRQSEADRMSGSSTLMAGITVIVLLFPRNVVLLTLLFFALADPLASYFGIRYGKRDKLIGNKSLQGSLAAFAACFVMSLLFYTIHDLMRERLFIVGLLSGLVGAFSELVPIWRIDDNFVFPVMCAMLLTGLFYVFGGL